MSAQDPQSDSAADVFRFGEFAFDCRLRQLLHKGEPRHLSPKAQQLLHLLLMARPRVLSREQLYDALWPSTFVSETNLASVVNELRRALGDDARAPKYIRTVHSFGYSFCGDVSTQAPTGAIVASLVCEGWRHALYEGENVIGRDSGNRIVLPYPTISRRHAAITIAGSEMTIRDLDSKNGTYVNRQRVGASPVPVKPQMLIELGVVPVSLVLCRTSSTRSLHLDPRDSGPPIPQPLRVDR